MYYTLNWKLQIAISTLIIVTQCQEIGEECRNKNGRVGICQLKNKCSKANELGVNCNSEIGLICCTKITNKRSNLNNSQNDDHPLLSRNTFITEFYQVPISSQKPNSNINVYSFNVEKDEIPDFVSNSNTKYIVENRPVQNFDQNKETQLNNNTNNNQNIEVIDNDGSMIPSKITKNNNNYPNYETQNINQNQKNTYPSYQITTNKNRPYYESYPANQNNNNRPYQETHQSNQNSNFNINPIDYNTTQKPQDNSDDYEYNSQLTNSKTDSNNHEINRRPNRNNNYRPTSSSILFPSYFEDKKYTTTTNKYHNRPNANTKRISEIKCEEYSKPVTTTISALDLSIGPAVKPVSVEKCDSKSVQLIVGGTKAYLGEFPHMVAVGFNTSIGNPWNCGGTLISDKFVLTAAHCTHSSLGKPVRVRLGDLNLQKNNDGANPIEFLVDEIIIHPNYVSTSKYNDLALLRLDKTVKFDDHIRPACLYNNDKIYARKVTATGWGSIGYGEESSDDLLKVNLDVIDNPQCNKLYDAESKSKTLNKGIVDSMICAGVLAGGRDTCLGDSGGPLVLRSEKNACVFNLIGITSFGKFCATENAPGVYTKVSAFISWIEQTVWSENFNN